ncbi:MAG: XdhC/CoxI family protein [Gemmatimonadota bacterium]
MAAEPLTAAQAAAALIDARRAGRDLATVVSLSGASRGQRILVYRDGAIRGTFGDPAVDSAARQLACAALQYGEAQLQESSHLFAEAQLAAPRLIIVGAGHIAVPLAHIGRLIGFEVTVLDDREEFATESRFESNVAVRHLDLAQPFDRLELGPRCHVVLVTRAHRLDYDLLRVLLSAPDQPAYIGMIGSRRRVRAAFHALIRAGIPREKLEAIHAPIGLDIGAETPAEIAVAIAAELIHFRTHAGDAQSLGAHERVLDRFFSGITSDA